MTSGIKFAADLLTVTCHQRALSAGWWETLEGKDLRENPLCFSNKLLLIVSEISEAMEGDRKNLQDDKLPHRKMAEVELADAVIRIFDLAGGFDFELGAAIEEKLKYNESRLDHNREARKAHGGKVY